MSSLTEIPYPPFNDDEKKILSAKPIDSAAAAALLRQHGFPVPQGAAISACTFSGDAVTVFYSTVAARP